MKTCPRCSMPLDAPAPVVGEVWLRVETGHLYRVTEATRRHESGLYGLAVRCRPPKDACDTTYECAMWPDSVASGLWLKVENPAHDDAAPAAGQERKR